MKYQDLYEQRHNFFLSQSSFSKALNFILIGVGLACFILGMMQEQQLRTWGSFLFNLLFFYAIALGGVAFGGMQDLVGAVWGRPVKRIHESFYSFIPVSSVLIFAYLVAVKFDVFGAGHIYTWVADPHMLHHFPGKDIWLQYDFMFFRDLFSLLVILALTTWHIKTTTKLDMAMIDSGSNEDGMKKLAESTRVKLRHWSAPVLVCHALAFSVLCFDITMSLAPTWFSTLWGGWSFAIMMQTLMAFLLLVMFSLKGTNLGSVIGQQQFHDIGKLMHGFTIFFAYLTFAHILTYWYTNIPEETSYLLLRMNKPWVSLAIVVLFLGFLIPLFALMPKASKFTPYITIPICILILVAQWITYLLVVIPELVKDVEQWSVPWIEIGLFCGFLGLFIQMFYMFASRVPMLSIADPLLPDSLKKGH